MLITVPEWIPIGQEARVCMCHPHSVRIEMKRFKSLLDEYNNDQLLNIRKGRRHLTYLEWARNSVKSKIKKRQKSKYAEDGTYMHKMPSKGMVVEVMKLMIGSGESKTKQVKRRKTVSVKKKKANDKEKDDFRLAMRFKKSVALQKKQTPVLCLLEAGDDYHYFAGNIVAIIEDHARIHFAGTTKDDDIWISVDSDMLFLDGGSCEKP